MLHGPETGSISDKWKMLQKGPCLQLCLCSEQRYWLKHQGVCLHETGSFFFHSGTNYLHLVKTNGSLLPPRRQKEELSSKDGLVKEFVQALKNCVSFLSLRVWIHSSPFPAAIGLLWEPQASSVENNQKFKIPGPTEKITEGKVLEKTPTWVSVPLKTTELVTNK